MLIVRRVGSTLGGGDLWVVSFQFILIFDVRKVPDFTGERGHVAMISFSALSSWIVAIRSRGTLCCPCD